MKNLVYKKYIDISSSSDKIAIGDITNEQFNIVSKTVNQGDEFSISEALETLIETIVIDNKRISTLSRIDKALIIFSAYKDSVNDKITINTDEGSTQIYVQTIIDSLYNVEDNLERSVEIDNARIILSSPRSLFYSDTADLLLGCIDKIICDGDVYIFSEFAEDDKNKFLDSITYPILDECTKFIEELVKYPRTTIVPKIISKTSDYSISIIDNSLYYILRSIFNIDYNTILEYKYIFTSMLHGDIKYYNEMTPFEFEDYIKIHQSYQKKNEGNLSSQ